ncbi:hypothetical protein ABIA38_006748 [Embleya sp. AB8]
MAEQFSVDFAWLDTLIAAFDGSTRATDAALGALEETGPIRTGHKDLDTACDHFNSKWEKRVKDFRGQVLQFRGVVDVSKAAYGATEQHVSTSMSRLAGSPPPVPPRVALPPPAATDVDSPLRSILNPNAASAPPSAPPSPPGPSRIGEAFK